LSEPEKEHHGDLLTFDDGSESGLKMTRWEYLMDLYMELPEKFTVTPFAERTDIVPPVKEGVDALEATELFDGCVEDEREEDEMLECYEIDF
jgi:hypothetical protein